MDHCHQEAVEKSGLDRTSPVNDSSISGNSCALKIKGSQKLVDIPPTEVPFPTFYGLFLH